MIPPSESPGFQCEALACYAWNIMHMASIRVPDSTQMALVTSSGPQSRSDAGQMKLHVPSEAVWHEDGLP